MIRYASVCDGIGAAHAAWKPLGWECAWTSEIEPFPAAVVEHHYQLPNLGDMTKITEAQLEEHGRIDLLVGGTPCQSFSVAGLRGGLDDPRGNLAIRFFQLAGASRARWVVFENVPGVLSSGGGRDFGSILGAMAELGYGWAYRVLDAQYFGVAQRRRRVFVVGCLGSWQRAAAVLLERHSMSGHPAPSRKAGAHVAGGTDAGTIPILEAGKRCGQRNSARDGLGVGKPGDPMFTLQAVAQHAVAVIPIDMRQASRGATMTNNRAAGSTGGAPGTGIGEAGDPAPTVSTSHVPAIAFDTTQITSKGNYSNPKPGDPCHPLAAGAHPPAVALAHMAVRRLTPREAERLQGFADDYTAITYRGKPAADGPRYKALGNSFAVPVVRWIGKRIEQVEAIA